MASGRIIIVDEHDREIGVGPRDQVKNANIYRATGLWLTNPAGDILLAQRSWDKTNSPGKWGPAAAGTVDEGETYEINVYKEAEEEIGLIGITFELGPKVFVDGDNIPRHFTQWFTAQVDWPLAKFKIQVEEVERIVWVSRRQFLNELKTQPSKYIPGASRWEQMFL